MQKRSIGAAFIEMEEEEEEWRAFGGGGGTTTTTTTLATATDTDRTVGGGTHAAGVRRPRSGSIGGGGEEWTSTNAIRLPMRTTSAS